MHEVLTVKEMYAADKAANESGIETYDLMEAAGRGVADAVIRLMPAAPVAVLCGPGNNGGDGFVAARRLRELGRNVTVCLLGDVDALEGDAARAAKEWDGPVSPLGEDSLDGAGVVIDALFGAGLSRPLEGAPAALADTAASRQIPVVAVDVPSGLDGDRACPKGDGPAFRAALTITFFRKKPAHVLMPGAAYCGEIIVHDIGIPASVLPAINPAARENTPDFWKDGVPKPDAMGHKHSRGRLAVISGGEFMTGAARLSARAGQRVGAGFVTLYGDEAATRINAAHETSIVLKAAARGDAMVQAVKEFHPAATIIGPGAGRDDRTKDMVLGLLEAGSPVVLDADALSIFEDDEEVFYKALHDKAVLTPHDGEFARVFPKEAGAKASKIEKARSAAKRSGAVVLCKGPDTVIARPDGLVLVNTVSSPFLASAGTGDVLSGMIGGLLAQGVEPFAAACMGAWIHGRAGQGIGPGLIAEDLIRATPRLMQAMLS